ncbi:MAG: hypothetical protein LBR23_00385, partial [Spirochaetaceae bacterium]|nr:hypothetical protein [Spirochaetaceae bacterium]
MMNNKNGSILRYIGLTALALGAVVTVSLAGCNWNEIKYEMGVFERPLDTSGPFTVTYDSNGGSGTPPSPRTVSPGT